MAEFAFTELLPLGPDATSYRLVSNEGVSTFETSEGTFLKVEPSALTRLTAEAMHDIAHFLRAGAPPTTADGPRRSGGERQRPVRRPRPVEERRDRGRRRAADVPGHRDGHRQGEEGPAGVHRRRRRGGHRPRRVRDVSHEQPALQPVGADHDVRRAQHRHQPPRRDQDRGDRRRRVQVLVHRQGRRQRQQELPVPGDQGAAERGDVAALAVRQDADPGDGGLPAVPPGRRDRRDVGRVSRSRRRSWPRRSTSTRSPPPARRQVTRSATSTSSARCCGSPRPPGSVPSSVASTSATTSVSSASPATARAARWRWPCRARPTGRRSARSPATGSSSRSSNAIRRGSCPMSPTTTSMSTIVWLSSTSTSPGRWTRSAPSSRSTRCARASC